ncbi:hypothetical protein AMTRI_Chr13g84380 [Amborella trichopoda]
MSLEGLWLYKLLRFSPTSHEKKPAFHYSMMFLLILLIMTASIVATVKLSSPKNQHPIPHINAVSKARISACKTTLYPIACESSMASFAQHTSNPVRLFEHSVRYAMDRAVSARDLALNLTNTGMVHGKFTYSGMNDCLELLEDSIGQLFDSLDERKRPSPDDIHTWLSSALTNQATCLEGLEKLKIKALKDLMDARALGLMQDISNTLALYKYSWRKFTPPKTRRLLSITDNNGDDDDNVYNGFFSKWAFKLFSSSDLRDRILISNNSKGHDSNSIKNIGDDNKPHNMGGEFRKLVSFTSSSSNLPSNNISTNIVGASTHKKETNENVYEAQSKGGFPEWVSVAERRLLEASREEIKPHAVVALDGSGTHMSLAQALKAVPGGSGRQVIYMKTGVYKETIKIPRSHSNVMLVGDGKGKTIITSNHNAEDGWTTFQSATFAATGPGFMARDITFENTAGPAKHQGVALRLGSDRSVIYRCSIVGYQDTLYAHSNRQFYRETDIYGTVDFIFGNAAAVFQSCNLYARKPMSDQRITYTAQGRKDPNQNTGFSIHNCKITAASDLVPVKSSIPTYLGRPWQEFSRTVIMQSFLDDLIRPAGWLEWSGNFALKSLYYGEYMNKGPGAGLSDRVRWPGYKGELTVDDATKFTVAQFISGNSWLPATGVSFDSGLIA